MDAAAINHRNKHIGTLDGLRGFAALLVLLSHFPTMGLPGIVHPRVGDYGVLLFFELSGFLMGYLYLSEPFRKSSVIKYGFARAGRIAPLYLIVVFAAFALSSKLPATFVYHMDTAQFVRLLLFSGNISVFWSIGPEVQCYLLFVLIWLVASTGKLDRLDWFVGAGIVIGFAVLAQSRSSGILVTSKLHIFLVGLLVAHLFTRLEHATSKAAITAAQIIAVAFLVTVALPSSPIGDLIYPPSPGTDEKHDAVFGNLKIVLLVGVVLLSLAQETAFSKALFANRAARLIGLYSFSIYLLHEPVMQAVGVLLAGRGLPVFVVAAAGVGATLVASAITYTLIERPGQRATRRVLSLWQSRSDQARGRRPEPLAVEFDKLDLTRT